VHLLLLVLDVSVDEQRVSLLAGQEHADWDQSARACCQNRRLLRTEWTFSIIT
jgi:hypothetical protein